MNSDLPLAGQTAVVTGATQGIGRAIAIELARAGADVVVHGRNRRAGAEQTAQSVIDQGRASRVLLADLSEEADRQTLVADAWQWHNQVDIWVNNAGADVLTGPLAEADFSQKLDVLWRVDVLGTIALSRAVGGRMFARQRGVILNVGWDQAEFGMAGDSGELFATTKGAIMAFTRSLARSLAPHVRVNCLAPGWIRTQWGENASPAWQARACREALRGRWGTPADVAQAARFLASPASDFLTGLILPVNGGWAGSATVDSNAINSNTLGSNTIGQPSPDSPHGP